MMTENLLQVGGKWQVVCICRFWFLLMMPTRSLSWGTTSCLCNKFPECKVCKYPVNTASWQQACNTEILWTVRRLKSWLAAFSNNITIFDNVIDLIKSHPQQSCTINQSLIGTNLNTDPSSFVLCKVDSKL